MSSLSSISILIPPFNTSFLPLALGEVSATAGEQHERTLGFYKNKSSMAVFFDGFCLFWRTNALNSGVLGVEPLRSFFGYAILIILAFLLCSLASSF